MLSTGRTSRSPISALTAALMSAGAFGGAWLLDARRRERHAHRLHRTIVDLLLNTLHAGDPRTGRHSRRVAELAEPLAESYRLDRSQHTVLRLAALLHDLAKIDDRFFDILHSCERLTAEQRNAIEGHPDEAADIVRPLDRVHPGLAAVIEAHHERWDGKGYPDKLRGEQIPLAARILSVADVFDALTQPRSYREAMAVDDALAKLRESAGERFDPDVVRRVHEPDVVARWREIVRRGREEERQAEATDPLTEREREMRVGE